MSAPTFLYLGARRGEVFKLKWTDVDLSSARVRLATHKTRDGSTKFNWVPMTQELRASLLWWWENRKHKHSEFVFTITGDRHFVNDQEGERFRYRQHFMRRICEKAGVKPFGYHAIRHLSAITLNKAGYPVATIQQILRHENPTTTEKYLRSLGCDLDDLRSAVETFSKRGKGKILSFTKNKAPGDKLISEG